MARTLTYKDLCEILSNKCFVTETTVERLLENLVLLIANELQNNSYISIKNIGKFSTEIRGGTDEWMEDSFGTLRKRYVEPFNYINFEPSQNLLDVVNGESINYLFNKIKLKYDKPTPFEELVDKNIEEDNISDAVKKILTKKKDKKERKKDEKKFTPNDSINKINEQIQRPILCKNNNVIYPSINRAAIELGISYSTLKLHTYGGINDMKCGGYEFELIEKQKKDEETENGKV